MTYIHQQALTFSPLRSSREPKQESIAMETNGYVCFYESQRWETCADTLYAAKQAAVTYFKPSKTKKHMVHCVLAEKNGETVTHRAID